MQKVTNKVGAIIKDTKAKIGQIKTQMKADM